MFPEITESAYKHGVTEEEIRHVLAYFMFVDESRHDVTILTGPGPDGALYEVGISSTTRRVIHAMPVRVQFLPLKRKGK